MARSDREEHNWQKGLSRAEAERRLLQFGENTLQQKKKVHPLKIFVGQFRDFMVLILLGATAVSVLMGEPAEALTIAVIVLLNALLGFFQEYRTEQTLEKLKNMSAPSARVIRDQRQYQIPAAEIVPGDLILIKSGDRVPADGDLMESSGLQVDEALLSGESNPVHKQTEKSQESDGGFSKNKVYMGTTVTSGHGKVIVTETGMATQMGQIAGMLDDIEPEKTPLQEKLGVLGKYIGIGCLIICAIVTITGIFRGEPVFDMFLTGISLAVAAIPEGLPAVVTVALALAVSRMVKRGALIRKLHAVESLGCAQVICTDKTGTLTENRMTAVTVRSVEDEWQIKLGTRSDSAVLDHILQAAVLCNNESSSASDSSGDPTEKALLKMAENCGLSVTRIRRSHGRIHEDPFDSGRKRMSVIVRQSDGKEFLYAKGAPDYLLDLCTYYQGRDGIQLLTPQVRKQIQEQNEQMAQNALRVLGFAYKPDPVDRQNAEQNLIFLGLAGLIDPPRKEAYAAVEICKKAGIRTVMITGDHVATASAIAKDLKILGSDGKVISGKELERMSDEQLDRTLDSIRVFARVAPSHKLRIVKAYKRQGKVVAMTGDGVNDAPAIKEADIGVSMGNGTDVTKEAASVILLDSSFATLVRAIEEGRVIYQNIRKFIRYLLACNIGEIVTMFFGMLMGMPTVLLPIQILIVNLATDGLPAIALGLDPAERDIMLMQPRKREEGIFSDGLLSTILFRGLLIGLTTLAVFTAFFHQSGDLTLARTAALATLVATQLIHVFECKREHLSLFQIPVWNNKKLILSVTISAAILLCCIQIPLCNHIFQTAPMTLKQYGQIGCYCVAVPILSSVFMAIRKKAPIRT